jgi:LuxR family transcriptional regulator, maltose regulon positive regulatory protein
MNNAAWLSTITWIRLGLGNRAAALESLAQFDEQLAVGNYWLRQRVIHESQRALLALTFGDTARASTWARRYEGMGATEYMRATVDLALARVYLAENNPSAALDLLKYQLPGLEALGRMRDKIENLLLQTLALQQLNRTSEALPLLRQAVDAAAPEGFVYLFAAEGRTLRRMLAALQIPTGAEPAFSFVISLLADPTRVDGAPARGAHAPAAPAAGLVEALTGRELEVLQLFATGLSNAEIAARLFLSTNTLKAHTQNIYSKLDVHSRMQAVNKARALNLLAP